ncbi:MAG: hypothetical protein ACRD30_00245 [Bryobacteraceae bacterium]
MPSLLSSGNAWPVFIEAVLGFSIGALIGLLIRMSTRGDLLGVIADAVLGMVGFAGGALATAYMPWKLNTVTYRVGDTIVSTTMRRYQHPYRAAFILAIALPVIYEAIRFALRKRKQS